ncbi:hypothetical protein QT971_23730, partial [Microcoleus sp. herbarium19]
MKNRFNMMLVWQILTNNYLARLMYNYLLKFGCISILQGRSIPADNLLMRIRDLLPECFAPTNIFA